ncbi:phosphodiester glycosidase family protein [Desulfovibrio sp. OttesenSCG-928-O18]|nr:phosphodiester glycosidase family protein [Desulfovibrio sp. OttesenSCG-928-O18]
MTGFRAAAFCLCFLVFSWAHGARAAEAPAPVAWKTLEPGLELAQVPLAVVSDAPVVAGGANTGPATFAATLSVVRIAPDKFVFSLYMASESGPRTLAEVGERENFSAAINAGMYLPDRSTSTGYLRSATHTNNGRVAANFGAFFVAEPADKKLPRARLLDRTRDDWQKALQQYGLVMQNYRMTTPEGRLIWKQGDRPHSVAALSQDNAGNILFLFCPDPVPATDFMSAVLRLPLGIKSVMYLEGGIDAALLIRSGDVKTVRTGRHASGLWSGGAGLALPNVLGVRRR